MALKKQRLIYILKKKKNNSATCCLQETLLKYKNTNGLKVGYNVYHAETVYKK